MKARKYVQVVDGDTVEVEGRVHKIACCDCGLVHLLRFRMKGSAITFRVEARQPSDGPKTATLEKASRFKFDD